MTVPATGVPLIRQLRRSALVEFVQLCRRPENRSILVVSLFAAAFLLRKAWFLVYPDLAFSYPFVTFDAFQWMLDGEAYLGHDVTATYRNPGLPFIVLALNRLGIVRYLPVLTTVLLGIFFVYLALLLRKEFDAPVVALTLLLLFFNFSVQTFFDFVLADQWAITCGLIAVYHLREAGDDPGRLLHFGLWVAISLLFQYAILFLMPAFLVYFLLEIRPAQGTGGWLRHAAGAIAAGGLVIAPIFIYKLLKFGNPIHSGVVYFPLVKPHFFGMFFYAVNFCAFFGLPAAFVILFGFIRGLKQTGAHLLVNLCLISYAVFWVLLYSWLDPRFILYSVPFAAFALARGISELQLPSLLSWNGRHLSRMGVAWGLLGFALLYALHDRGTPFTFDLLPLSPQNVLRFKPERITAWEGNFTINVDGLRLDNVTDGVPGLSFLKSYYPRHRRSVDRGREEERAELAQASAAARDRLGPAYRIGSCGDLPSDYYSSMRREIIFRRRLRACGEHVDARLYPRNGPGASGSVIFSGIRYVVVEGDGPAPRKMGR